jgi:hypothetical protein
MPVPADAQGPGTSRRLCRQVPVADVPEKDWVQKVDPILGDQDNPEIALAISAVQAVREIVRETSGDQDSLVIVLATLVVQADPETALAILAVQADPETALAILAARVDRVIVLETLVDRASPAVISSRTSPAVLLIAKDGRTGARNIETTFGTGGRTMPATTTIGSTMLGGTTTILTGRTTQDSLIGHGPHGME